MKTNSETRTKRMVALLLALLTMAALLTALPFTASAETSGIYTYTVSDGEARITDCDTSASGAIEIPSTLGGYPVTSIGDFAFYFCKSLTSITIPAGVTSIGDSAFRDCYSLESITIPDSVISIGDSAFLSCTSLESIEVDENNNFYSSDTYGVLFNKEKTTLIQYPIGNVRTAYIVPDSVTIIGFRAFNECDNLHNVTIGKGVTVIDEQAFPFCGNLRNITMGNSVTTIGENAFSYCENLRNVTLGNSVKTIGKSAFSECTSLNDVTIPYSVTTIEYSAFSGCTSLNTVIIQNGVETIGGSAFGHCSMSTVTIPASVKSIGTSVFSGCSNLTSIEVDLNNSFYSSDDSGVLFDKEKTTLIQYPAGSERTNYTVPDGVTVIGDSAFEFCTNLRELTIGTGTTTIDDFAFRQCKNLVSIMIPVSVELITISAFSECDSLTDVYYAGSEEAWEKIEITDGEGKYGNIPEVTIHYNYKPQYTSGTCGENLTWTLDDNGTLTISGTGAMENYAYRGTAPWYDWIGEVKTITIGNGVTTISDHAFWSCMYLKNITIGSGVTVIGEGAFSDCSNLTSIEVDPNNGFYSSDDSGVLFDKEKTTLIQYPVGNRQTNYTVPDGVTVIGDSAFEYCTNLRELTIPNSVTTIESYAFSGCYNLTDVYYRGRQALWEQIVIAENNSNLTDATIHFRRYHIALDEGIFFSGGEIGIISDEAISGARLIVAAYKGGELLSMKLASVSILEGETRIANPMTDFGNADTVRIMLWSSTGIAPLFAPFELKL